LLVSPSNATHLSINDSLLVVSESDADDNSTPSVLSFTDDTLSNVSSNLDDSTPSLWEVTRLSSTLKDDDDNDTLSSSTVYKVTDTDKYIVVEMLC